MRNNRLHIIFLLLVLSLILFPAITVSSALWFDPGHDESIDTMDLSDGKSITIFLVGSIKNKYTEYGYYKFEVQKVLWIEFNRYGNEREISHGFLEPGTPYQIYEGHFSGFISDNFIFGFYLWAL